MISELIAWEGGTLLTSLFWGMILAGEYDCIRIFRRIIKHRKVWTIAVEDILYWTNAGITVFCVIYELNDGIVRGFSVAGFIVGAVIYRFSFGLFFVKYISKLILFVLKPLKKCWCLIRMALKKVFGKVSVRLDKARAAQKKNREARRLQAAEKKKAAALARACEEQRAEKEKQARKERRQKSKGKKQ